MDPITHADMLVKELERIHSLAYVGIDVALKYARQMKAMLAHDYKTLWELERQETEALRRKLALSEPLPPSNGCGGAGGTPPPYHTPTTIAEDLYE